MWGIGGWLRLQTAYIRRLEAKIERQRVELTNLRRKREKTETAKFGELRSRLSKLEGAAVLAERLKRDLDSAVGDNERLRSEIVRLSGGSRSHARPNPPQVEEV